MKIKAKMSCYSVQPGAYSNGEKYSENVSLCAVYSADPKSENKTFCDSTPSATINLTITNKDAFGAFEVGKEYYVDFTPAN